MKAYLKGIKILNYVWLVLVFLIIFLACVPIIPGTILVQLPGPDGWTTTTVNGTVNVTGDVSVHNGGFFSFNNFYFIVVLYADNGSVIAEFASARANLLPGLWTTFPVYFLMNESALSSSLIEALLFSNVTFSSLVYFNTNYLFDFQVQAGAKGHVTIGPFVKDFQVDKNNTVIRTNGTNYILDVPYHINTTSILQGKDLWINGTMSNATGQLANFTTLAKLGTNYRGNFTIQLSEDAYNHLKSSSDLLYINTTMTLNQFNWTTNFEVFWTPPAAPSATIQSYQAEATVAPNLMTANIDRSCAALPCSGCVNLRW
jgi:hypothetical protein